MNDQYELVTVYGVRHTIGGSTVIFLGQEGKFYQYEVPLDEARFLLDLLRNEKPIYINPLTRTLSTSTEPVGEAEK